MRHIPWLNQACGSLQTGGSAAFWYLRGNQTDKLCCYFILGDCFGPLRAKGQTGGIFLGIAPARLSSYRTTAAQLGLRDRGLFVFMFYIQRVSLSPRKEHQKEHGETTLTELPLGDGGIKVAREMRLRETHKTEAFSRVRFLTYPSVKKDALLKKCSGGAPRPGIARLLGFLHVLDRVLWRERVLRVSESLSNM